MSVWSTCDSITGARTYQHQLPPALAQSAATACKRVREAIRADRAAFAAADAEYWRENPLETKPAREAAKLRALMEECARIGRGKE